MTAVPYPTAVSLPLPSTATHLLELTNEITSVALAGSTATSSCFSSPSFIETFCSDTDIDCAGISGTVGTVVVVTVVVGSVAAGGVYESDSYINLVIFEHTA